MLACPAALAKNGGIDTVNLTFVEFGICDAVWCSWVQITYDMNYPPKIVTNASSKFTHIRNVQVNNEKTMARDQRSFNQTIDNGNSTIIKYPPNPWYAVMM